MQGVKVYSAGLYSSIQDPGRSGYRKYGLPQSGAMDWQSAARANMVLGNASADAVLEITLAGPRLKFLSPCRLAISGAKLSPSLNDLPLELNRAIQVAAGDCLSFGKPIFGCRSYLAVQGGFQTPVVLGSRAYFRGITAQECITTGDVLPLLPYHPIYAPAHARIKSDSENFNSPGLAVYAGPEYPALPRAIQKALFEETFSLSREGNRMGIRLNGPALLSDAFTSMLTTAVQPGTVQLTPSGQLIVLMRDAQTTGGYPRVLQLTEAAINCLAQKKAGDEVRFRIHDPANF